MIWLVCLGLFAVLGWYLRMVDRLVTQPNPEAAKLSGKPWTKEQLTERYQQLQQSQPDVRPALPPKQGRRYVVTGGSGLVGGWIVHHLIMRGEDPAAIRIVDLSPTKREEAIRHKVDFVKTDVSDQNQVKQAFIKAWPSDVASLPLTVFHCVAYINPAAGTADFLGPYVTINLEGTRNVIAAAKDSGADCFVSTSSGSVGITNCSYWPLPWQKSSSGLFQISENAENAAKTLDRPLEASVGCYTWTKAQAEMLVHAANSPTFRTGAIRPANAIYGHGVENPSALTWDYLRRGGSPTWIRNIVSNFVNAQNVSIGHLAYENALLTNKSRGGKGYCVTDPNPPIRYGDLYRALILLAHPTTPVKFDSVPHVPMLTLAYVLEGYDLLRVRYFPFLPQITGDLSLLRPAMFRVCTLNVIFTDTAAKEEIGYTPTLSTLDGVLLAILDWNTKIEAANAAKIAQGEADKIAVREPSAIPKPPKIQ